MEDIDKMFDGMAMPRNINSLSPAIDIYETASEVIVETALPGVDPKKIDIGIENGVLTVSGSSERKTEIDEKDYYRKEIRSGSFMRQIALPANVIEGEAHASFKDGILKIAMTKLNEPKAKKIEVKIEDETK